MTDCTALVALVEKYSDGEATAAEKLAAEAHLEKCPSCRSHVLFLASLTEESRSMPFPEPPESYWEHLPRKVLDRIDSESRRPSGFFRILLAPSMLRWGALGATLLVVTTVGVSVLREDPRTPSPPAVGPARAAPVANVPEAETETRVAAERSTAPPMARDEAAFEAEPFESLPSAEEREGAPAETVAIPATPDSTEDVVPSLRPASKENVHVLQSASRGRPAATPGSLSRAVLEDCDALRRAVASSADGQDGSDARFRLALCSLERYERDATDELWKRAIEDAEAFLAGESEGARAEEIREKLGRIKPD